MARQLATAASFGTIGPAIAVDIENSDRTTRLEAARFRFSRRLREIETQFEAEASKLRQAYCDECAEIWGAEAA